MKSLILVLLLTVSASITPALASECNLLVQKGGIAFQVVINADCSSAYAQKQIHAFEKAADNLEMEVNDD